MGNCVSDRTGPRDSGAESGIGDVRFCEVLSHIRHPDWIEKKQIHILRQTIPSVWKLLPAVDVALIFAHPLLLNRCLHDIIEWTKEINSQIDTMADYLSTAVGGEVELLEHKKIIQEGLEISLVIAMKKNKGERRKFAEKLNPLFDDARFTSALKAVINELTSRSCLLQDVYEKTNGHWSKVREFADRILSLIVGGLIVTAVYETWTSRSGKATEHLEVYRAQMEEIEGKIQSVYDKCKSEIKANMLKDLNKLLDGSASNDSAVTSLSVLMSEKYDWLVNYCIICDESIHLNYSFAGSHVKSLERNGKFGVIFYRDALLDETVVFDKWSNVVSILTDLAKNSSAYTVAEELCQTVINTCQAKGVEVCGCAVMRPKAAMQWIPYYGTPAMLAYGDAIVTLKGKGTCGTVCENWLSDPLRINPVDVVFFPIGIPLIAAETAAEHFREAGSGKARFFFVMYK